MGRIKTTMVKNIAKELLEKHEKKFGKDFETNKRVVKELIEIKSRKIRNAVAGYITNLKTRG